MAKKRFYTVSVNGIKSEVKSLPQAKKLIHGQNDWEVMCFTKDRIDGLKCLGIAWKEYYDLKKQHRWTLMTGNCDKLCLALHKSKIAK